jgi:hypothetical protein
MQLNNTDPEVYGLITKELDYQKKTLLLKIFLHGMEKIFSEKY